MTDNAIRYLALVSACNARVEGYKARNAKSAANGEPPFYTQDYFDYEASTLETYARELLA